MEFIPSLLCKWAEKCELVLRIEEYKILEVHFKAEKVLRLMLSMFIYSSIAQKN